MGRPYRRHQETSGQAEGVPTGSSGVDAVQQAPPRDCVDLGDTAAIKRTLDDVAAQVVLKAGFEEVHTVSNIKIGLGFLTCCWALLAQFYPKKYPANWHVLVLCLVAYLICTAVLNALMWFMEGEAFLFCRVGQQDRKAGPVLSLSSSLPKYQDMYTLQFQSRAGLSSRPSTVVQLHKSVTAYFDEEGSVLEEAYRRDVQHRLRQYSAAGKKRI